MSNGSKIVVFFLIIAGCAFAGSVAISDSQFVTLYVDLSYAAEQFLSDSVHLAAVQDSIFDAHDVTREQFFLYKNKLDSSPERWSVIWQMIADKLAKHEAEIQAREKAIEAKETEDKKK